MTMGEARKQIKVSEDTRSRLRVLKKRNEKYDTVILKLLKKGEGNKEEGTMDEKIVYTYVSGDIFHEGHLAYLEAAKALGGILIVGVLTDEAIMERKKAPVTKFPERLRLANAIKAVDSAIAQAEYSPVNNIRLLKPDVVVESTSHDETLLRDVRTCVNEIGGRIFVLPYYPEQSSSKIKERILKLK